MALQGVESWDDDLDFDGNLYNTGSTLQPSISSRLSIRSESNAGDEDWQVPLRLNDNQSRSNAISSAQAAGIPLPANVPSSALVGGSIKRLGKKPSTQKVTKDDWGDDLELPKSTGETLKVKPREATHTEMDDDFEDFTEGSLGIRYGGTRRSSNIRSPSASILSPSMRSLNLSDDGLDGLEIPSGFDLGAALQKRKDEPQPQPQPKEVKISARGRRETQQEDFLADFDIGAGEVFDPEKRTLNRNIKSKAPKEPLPPPPARPQTTLTFGDKSAMTRIPRPVNLPKPSKLEPVFESGATNITRSRVPPPPASGGQLLRSKRSMPALRSQPSAASNRPPPVPSLPHNHNLLQQHPANARTAHYNRRDSDPSRGQSPTAYRTHSRLSGTFNPPETPTRRRKDVAPAPLVREAAAKRNVTRPARHRNYGDGTELDTFDDLPTSAVKESVYMKQPTARAGPAPRALRTQPSQSRLGLREKMTTPMPPSTPRSPAKADTLPRFARDTEASKRAREQTLGVREQTTTTTTALPKPRDGVLQPRTNWAAQVAARTPQTSPTIHRSMRKGPQLVQHIGKENVRRFQDDAARKGMQWNPTLFRWEGNEDVLSEFETPAPPSPPRPALITPISGQQTIKVVGGMVFDPQRMTWLKIGQNPDNPISPSVDDEDDPFRGIEDLKDTAVSVDAGSTKGGPTAGGSEWLVGEEFDLGPAFINRQRDEEAYWRTKVAAWFGDARVHDDNSYRYAIREIAGTVTL